MKIHAPHQLNSSTNHEESHHNEMEQIANNLYWLFLKHIFFKHMLITHNKYYRMMILMYIFLPDK